MSVGRFDNYFCRHLGLAERFSIPDKTLVRFARAVCDEYHDHPFHNFHHAFSVRAALRVDEFTKR